MMRHHTKETLCNSEWAYQRHHPCYKCDVSLRFYLYPCGFDTTLYESHYIFNNTILTLIEIFAKPNLILSDLSI